MPLYTTLPHTPLCLMEALKRYAVRHGASQEVVPLVDIGANITKLKKAELRRQLVRAAGCGVTRVVVTGTSVRSSAAAAALASDASAVDGTGVTLYFTAGVHPHDANGFASNTVNTLQRYMAHPSCIAAGEMGLDYDRMYSPKDSQLAAFLAQARLALQMQKPMFIHERDRDTNKGPPVGSHGDLVRILDEVSEGDGELPPVCIHCFTGADDALRDYVSRGYYIGITGFVCMVKRGARLRAALTAGLVPMDRLMVETDAPYMKPDGIPDDVGVVGRTNEPCVLPTIVRTLAKCYNVEEAELALQVTKNTEKFFKL